MLQPNYFESLPQLAQTLRAFIAHYNRTAKPIQWTYTVEKLELKLGINLVIVHGVGEQICPNRKVRVS